MESLSFDLLKISLNNGVLSIKLNNPKKKNSITVLMLSTIIEVLNKSKTDNNVKVVYFTSVGETHTSGNDFNNFSGQTLDQAISGFQIFVETLIDYPKVLIAGVVGPAIGIGFSMLSFFDIVLCSDNAFFTAPFIQTFQVPEACSSLMFPILLGKSNAGHLLLNGGVLNAVDAKNLGFVTNIYEKEFFENDAYEYALGVAKHPLKNLIKIKSMINRNFNKLLHEVNKEECKDLRKSWDQKEFQGVIKKFVKNVKF